MFMAVKDCDKKSKNSEMDLQYFLKEEEINSLNNFIMDLPQYFNETEKSEIKVLRQLINDNIRDNLNGKNDKLKIKEYISNYELENNCQILDIFEKYFQFLSGPNMTTIGQVTLKKRNGKGYDTFLDRLIGTSNATHTVCKDQEADVIFYNMNAIKTLHPISDESFFNSCNFYNDQLNKLC
ncbi:hypothetical protein BpHYR1_053165 [Brachionus plicatilis]|uniref:Uncharacterized protein n=1 Tax=Brachionus plicatilis TaxID=10195 RepID=A0A3M7QMF0_BRAPC|nr:hypothetical protein BpHYR1_053165 [Brachionus plicatilis]